MPENTLNKFDDFGFHMFTPGAIKDALDEKYFQELMMRYIKGNNILIAKYKEDSEGKYTKLNNELYTLLAVLKKMTRYDPYGIKHINQSAKAVRANTGGGTELGQAMDAILTLTTATKKTLESDAETKNLLLKILKNPDINFIGDVSTARNTFYDYTQYNKDHKNKISKEDNAASSKASREATKEFFGNLNLDKMREYVANRTDVKHKKNVTATVEAELTKDEAKQIKEINYVNSKKTKTQAQIDELNDGVVFDLTGDEGASTPKGKGKESPELLAFVKSVQEVHPLINQPRTNVEQSNDVVQKNITQVLTGATEVTKATTTAAKAALKLVSELSEGEFSDLITTLLEPKYNILEDFKQITDMPNGKDPKFKPYHIDHKLNRVMNSDNQGASAEITAELLGISVEEFRRRANTKQKRRNTISGRIRDGTQELPDGFTYGDNESVVATSAKNKRSEIMNNARKGMSTGTEGKGTIKEAADTIIDAVIKETKENTGGSIFDAPVKKLKEKPKGMSTGTEGKGTIKEAADTIVDAVIKETKENTGGSIFDAPVKKLKEKPKGKSAVEGSASKGVKTDSEGSSISGYNGPTSNEIAYEFNKLRKLLTDRLNDFEFDFKTTMPQKDDCCERLLKVTQTILDVMDLKPDNANRPSDCCERLIFAIEDNTARVVLAINSIECIGASGKGSKRKGKKEEVEEGDQPSGIGRVIAEHMARVMQYSSITTGMRLEEEAKEDNQVDVLIQDVISNYITSIGEFSDSLKWMMHISENAHLINVQPETEREEDNQVDALIQDVISNYITSIGEFSDSLKWMMHISENAHLINAQPETGLDNDSFLDKLLRLFKDLFSDVKGLLSGKNSIFNSTPYGRQQAVQDSKYLSPIKGASDFVRNVKSDPIGTFAEIGGKFKDEGQKKIDNSKLPGFVRSKKESATGKGLMGIGKLLGVVGVGISVISRGMKILTKTSPVLSAVLDLFSLCFTLFFMPFGNAIGKGLLPLAIEMMEFILNPGEVLENKAKTFTEKHGWLVGTNSDFKKDRDAYRKERVALRVEKAELKQAQIDAGTIKNNANGGYIAPSPQGQLVRVGEGTRGEHIIPEGSNLLSGGGGQTINITFSGNVYGMHDFESQVTSIVNKVSNQAFYR